MGASVGCPSSILLFPTLDSTSAVRCQFKAEADGEVDVGLVAPQLRSLYQHLSERGQDQEKVACAVRRRRHSRRQRYRATVSEGRAAARR